MNNRKEKILLIVIFLIFTVIVFRLLQLQVIRGETYGKLADQNRVRIIKIPSPRGIIYDRNGIPLVENIPTFNLSWSPEYVESINFDLLSKIINIPIEELEKKAQKKSESLYLPIRIKDDLTFKEVAMLEARKHELPGLIIDIEMKRNYIYGKATAHLIGYLGKVTDDHIKTNPSYKDLPSYFKVGQTGLEYKYDNILRGIPGEKIVEVDALGRELRLIRETQPVKGEDLHLTIDIILQQAAYKVMDNYSGAFVAIKPDSGEILALVSTPSFDPNMFIEAVPAKYWSTLISDPKKPLINKTINGVYPPGSTFKIIPALAGLEENIIGPDQILVNCHGGLTFGKWTFGCWRKDGHGPVNLKKALAESCDVYFYELGKLLGIKRISKYASSFGLGSTTGFSSDEKLGLIPDEDWKRKITKHPWYLGDTFNTSIGQGFLKVTPIQMALSMAVIVNGGKRYKLNIIKDMQPQFENLGFKDKNLEIIKDALIATVNEPGGTAFQARSEFVKFGGKTGTVQVVSKKIKEKISNKNFEHHAWFIGFSPPKSPEIAFSVLIEHGGGGGAVAAPVAKNILEEYAIKKRQLNVKN